VVLPIITIVCGFLKDLFSLRNPRTITHLPSGYQMVQSDRKPSITANQVNYIVYKKKCRTYVKYHWQIFTLFDIICKLTYTRRLVYKTEHLTDNSTLAKVHVVK